MMVRRSSATELGNALVTALAERDFDRLAGTLTPDVRMRALIPPGPLELSGASRAASKFGTWFGDSDALELVRSGSDEIGDRLHVFYRLRVKRRGDPWTIIEQHLFCSSVPSTSFARAFVPTDRRVCIDRGGPQPRDEPELTVMEELVQASHRFARPCSSPSRGSVERRPSYCDESTVRTSVSSRLRGRERAINDRLRALRVRVVRWR